MKLRDYQRRCSDAIFDEWKEVNSTLAVLPTGCGKTVIFADVIRRCFPKRAMVIGHREELIWQAKDKIQRTTGLSCEIEMGEYKAHADLFSKSAVVVSTVQTQTSGGDGGGRMTKFDPQQFAVLIIDEGHHGVSASYRRMIDYYRSNPALKVLFVTATPDRADEEALGQVCDTVAFDYEILDAIQDGWLVPIDQQMVNVEGLDFSRVSTTAGDLNNSELAAVMEAEKNLQGIAGPSIDIIGQKRALVFTASVKHAETLSEIFNRHRAGMAAWVCGKTPKDDRRRILSDYAAGKIQVVCNCGVLTEGFDDPGVEVIIMGRPTKSRSLYSQMVGRSTRPLPGIVDGPETPELRRNAIAASLKTSCLVVDFVGNSGKHKLITSADILGGKVSEEAITKAVARAKQTGKPIRMADALDEEERAIEQRRRQLEEAGRKAKLVAKAKFSTQSVDPFDILQVQPVKSRGWDSGKILTEKQRAILSKSGIDPDAVDYGNAKRLIGAIIDRRTKNLCTVKQEVWLRKHGYQGNTTFEKASSIMSSWAENGWKRPPEKVYPPVPIKRELVTEPF